VGVQFIAQDTQFRSYALGYIEFGVWGLGFGVWGLGFGVWGSGSRPLCPILIKPRPQTVFPDRFVWISSHKGLSRS